MEWIRSILKDKSDIEPIINILAADVVRNDPGSDTCKDDLFKLGLAPEQVLMLPALYRSRVKYGYTIATETANHILDLALKSSSDSNSPLPRLVHNTFFLIKTCWLYEHAPYFLFYDKKNLKAKDELICEFANRFEPLLSDSTLGTSGYPMETMMDAISPTPTESHRKHIIVTSFWDRKFMDPMDLIRKVDADHFDGLELCVDFHPFNYTKLLPEEFSPAKRNQIKQFILSKKLKIDIHSPIIGPYVPSPDPAKGSQRFFDPSKCLAIQFETIDLAKDIGAGSVVFHLIDTANPKSMLPLIEKAAGSDVRVTIENYCQINSCQTSRDFLDCIEELIDGVPKEIIQKNFGITLDVGHLNIEGEDPLIGAERIGRWCLEHDVFIRMHATDNYGKLLFSPPDYSADVHNNVSGRGINNGLIIKMLRTMGLRFDVVAEQIKPLTPADIATIHNAQSCYLEHSFEEIQEIGRQKLDAVVSGVFIQQGLSRIKPYAFLAGMSGVPALQEYLAFRQIQNKKHLSVNEAKRVSSDFQKLSQQHKIDVATYIDDLLLPIQNETGILEKNRLDLICQNLNSVIYESLDPKTKDWLFAHNRVYRRGEIIYEQNTPGWEMYLLKEGQAEVFIDGISSAQLDPGKVFGEIGLFYDINRSATIRVVTDYTKVGILDRQGLMRLFSEGTSKASDLVENFFKILPARLRKLNEKYKEILTTLYLISDGDSLTIPELGHIQLENRIDNTAFVSVLASQEIRTFAAHQKIFCEGDPGDGAYYIIEGQVKVVSTTASNQEVMLGSLDEGKIFGEMALIDDTPRSATVLAVTPCKTAFISKPVFNEFIKQQSEIAYRLMGFICLSLYQSILRLDKFYTRAKNRKFGPDSPHPEFSQVQDLKKIGHYLFLDTETILSGINLQQQLALKGIKRLLGQVLLDMQAITEEGLENAITHQRMDRLKLSQIFTDLSETDLTQLSKIAKEKDVEPGDIIIRQDAPSTCFYVVIHGKVQIFRTDENNEEISIAVAGPGESVGEMGFFTGTPRSASVRALVPSQLIEIPYDQFNRCFKLTPNLAGKFLNIMAQRLQRSNLKIQSAYYKSRKTQQSIERFQVLLDQSNMSSMKTGIDGLINRVGSMAGNLLDAEQGYLFLLDANAQELWSKKHDGNVPGNIRIPLNKGIVGWVARHGEMVNLDDVINDERFDDRVDSISGNRPRSMLCSPVKNQVGNVIGVLEVMNKQHGMFTHEDEAALDMFASQVAIAIDNCYLFHQMLSSYHRTTIFIDMADTLSSTLDFDILTLNVITKISQILGAQRSILFMLDKESETLWSRHMEGTEKVEIRFPATKGISGYVATTGNSVNIRDAYSDPRFNPAYDRQSGIRTRSVLCVPIRNRSDKIIGVIQTVNKYTGAFSSNDEELLTALASQIAMPLKNALTHGQAVARNDFFRNIENAIGYGLLTLDNNWNVVTVNQHAKNFFSPDGHIIGQDIRDVVGYKNERLLHLIEKVYESNQRVSEYPLSISVSHSTRHHLRMTLAPVMDASGERQGVVLMFKEMDNPYGSGSNQASPNK